MTANQAVTATEAIKAMHTIMQDFEELEALKSIGIKPLQGMDLGFLKTEWIQRMEALNQPESFAWLERYGLLAHGAEDIPDLMCIASTAPNNLLMGLAYGHMSGWQLGCEVQNKAFRKLLFDHDVEQFKRDSVDFTLGMHTGWLFARTRFVIDLMLKKIENKKEAPPCNPYWKAKAAQFQKQKKTV